MTRVNFTALILIFAQVLLSACSSDSDSGSDANAPGAPSGLLGNAGDGALSVGWLAPANDGGAAVNRYQLTLEPAVPSSDIHISGTRAIVSNLSNGTAYSIRVAAGNSAGFGADSESISITPAAASPTGYDVLSINGDPGSPNGFYDPSLLRAVNGDLWLAYSSVNFYLDGNSKTVQDVGIRIARSTDNGASFDYVATVASPGPATVTDTTTENSACGAESCVGRWVYETSTLIEDTNDPDPDKRFKLFSPKYFIYPTDDESKTLYHLGAIVMFTASSPDASWSDETVLLGWPLSPPELPPLIDITSLSSDLANCFIVAEPGASVADSTLQLVFACPYFVGEFLQKIILLQSLDHGVSFQYVNTLLTPGDAPGAIAYYSAPSLIGTQDNAPLLLVTPVIDSLFKPYSGSVVFPFAAKSGNDLFRYNPTAEPILGVPVETLGHIGGASTYARGTGNLGILQSDAIPGATRVDTQFRIIATHTLAEP